MPDPLCQFDERVAGLPIRAVLPAGDATYGGLRRGPAALTELLGYAALRVPGSAKNFDGLDWIHVSP